MSALAKQRFLVVGGRSGIGLAIAATAIEEGAQVTIASRSRDKIATSLAKLGPSAQGVSLDTGDESAIERLFQGGRSWDHIAVSAAQTPSGPVRKLGLAEAKSATESKFWGAHRIARFANIGESGSLTFVSGFLSVRPSPTSVLQGAMNAALGARPGADDRTGAGPGPFRVTGLIQTPLWAGMGAEKREAMFASAAPAATGSPGRPRFRHRERGDVTRNDGFTTGSTVLGDGGGVIA